MQGPGGTLFLAQTPDISRHPFLGVLGPCCDGSASQSHLRQWLIGCLCPAGHTGRLLKALLGTSILFLLAHFVFQICLYTLPILDQLLGPSCEYWAWGQAAGGARMSPVPGTMGRVKPGGAEVREGESRCAATKALQGPTYVPSAVDKLSCAMPGWVLCWAQTPSWVPVDVRCSPHGDPLVLGLPASAPPSFPAGSTWEVLARHVGVTR